ncbi:conserved hypothetical protein [Flavobacterium sp. 9AF]|uniref:hypothetical protein n=1 Tax=Flavobacterium sp. 9AF TaxID=2653142 RepID=UPI0012F070B9|nr:hypothetical protein [Flavobacterium sp. 9AF]VXC01330.1 conserved hypothetical protein [Flavobacterium sp. 9AF]
MNKILSILIISFTMNSCKENDKVSIDKIDLTQSKKFFFNDANLMSEANEINTTLNFIYTNEVNRFKYGSVEFVNSNPDDMVLSKIGVLTKEPNNEKIEGIVLSIEDTQESIAILNELKKINGEPKVLKPIPAENDEGQLLGYSTYVWILQNDLAIVASQSYEYTDGVRSIASLIYIVSNKVRTTQANSPELVIDRLIKTYN